MGGWAGLIHSSLDDAGSVGSLLVLLLFSKFILGVSSLGRVVFCRGFVGEVETFSGFMGEVEI